MSTPAFGITNPEADAVRRANLRKYRTIATGALIIAAAIYFIMHLIDAPWAGYVQAAAEAGMVGGLADWFAVTALFKHPLGLKIPHTALVKSKKDQIGDNLSDFVKENFLDHQVISQKIHDANIPGKVGQYVSDNTTQITGFAAQVGLYGLGTIDTKTIEELVKTYGIDKLAEPEWGPPAGRVLAELLAQNKLDPLIDELAHFLHSLATKSHPVIERVTETRTERWGPLKLANSLISDKVYQELVNFTSNVVADPQHELRLLFKQRLRRLADELQHDPEMIARAEVVKNEIMAAKPVADLGHEIGVLLTDKLREALETPDSALRQQIAGYLEQLGEKLTHNVEWNYKTEQWLIKFVLWLTDNYGGQITTIIGDTIRGWDADSTSEKIELMVGKDLQYIRLNGTVVGALAGLVIYSISQLLIALT